MLFSGFVGFGSVGFGVWGLGLRVSVPPLVVVFAEHSGPLATCNRSLSRRGNGV